VGILSFRARVFGKQKLMFDTAGWDLVPGPKHAIRLFLSWDGEFYMWRGNMQIGKNDLVDPKDNGFQMWERNRDSYLPMLRMKADLKEQFLAHTGGHGDFFFVTASGKAYRLHQEAKKWKLDLVWSDKSRPVRLLVTDSKNERTFAFAHSKGKPTKAAPDVYFPLSGKLKPVAYERDRASPASASESDAALLAAARLLVKKGEIKAKWPARSRRIPRRAPPGQCPRPWQLGSAESAPSSGPTEWAQQAPAVSRARQARMPTGPASGPERHYHALRELDFGRYRRGRMLPANRREQRCHSRNYCRR
jgi:hypothetical protein